MKNIETIRDFSAEILTILVFGAFFAFCVYLSRTFPLIAPNKATGIQQATIFLCFMWILCSLAVFRLCDFFLAFATRTKLRLLIALSLVIIIPACVLICAMAGFLV